MRRANLQRKGDFLKRSVIGILPGQIAFVVLAGWAFLPVESRADFLLGQASNYAVLVEPNVHNFGLTSDSGVFGNVGIGNPINAVQLAGGTITGNLDFSGLPASGGPNFGGTVIGSVGVGVSAVTTALNTVNSLSTTLGAESGTALVVAGAGQTINASAGTLDGSGNRVFTVASNKFNLSGGITINGSASDFVVININQGTSNEKINGAVSLTGGITSDQVLFNFFGASGELGAAANKAVANGIFLAPNMKVNIDAVTINGRLFGGGDLTDNNDFKIVSNAFVNQPPPSTSTAVPEPASLTLFGTAIVGLICWDWRRRRMAA